MHKLFATSPRGIEELLKKELQSIGATSCHIVQGGVEFEADEITLYRSLLWSRLASRILLPIAEFDIYSDLDLYSCALNIRWHELFDVNCTFVVHFSGTNDFIRHSQYGALKIKDAIVDAFIRREDQRPTVDKQSPDVAIYAYLNKNHVVLSYDLSGASLHQRGYRHKTGQAPLKENLASAIIMRSGWQQNSILLDPMCGSGTLLIEAAMMAANIPPGLNRTHWGFMAWQRFNPTLWEQVLSEAKENIKAPQYKIIGYDKNQQVIKHAKQNAINAGVDSWIDFSQRDVIELTNPCPDELGIVISNPPYGERMESSPALIALYTVLAQRLKAYFGDWKVSLFSAAPELLDCIQMRANRQFKAKNGALDCLQKNYTITKRAERDSDASVPRLFAADFANRLRKNEQKLSKWAKQEDIDCYRLYDADLPEYNVAIDRYQHHIVVQEYAPPKNIDEKKAKQRLYDVINATMSLLGLSTEQLILKTRERQKGKQQYQAIAKKQSTFLVKEYHAKFWVNLTDYLDTGLFLDHRLVRKLIGNTAKGKDFLNLFAYTGSASVYAGLGGAQSTTTVDMSRTYLEWAERNLKVNGLSGRKHRLIQADCLFYLKACDEQFDLIFIDPPTFSNSKRMTESFDVQRDHIKLMADLKRLLRVNGTIIFSNNKRGFKIDYEGLQALNLKAQDITEKTISLDFKRHKQIHSCFIIKNQYVI